MKRVNRRERRHSNRLVCFAIVLVVIAAVWFFNARGKEIKAKNSDNEKTIEQLNSQIEDESRRAEELEERAKYVNTKQYIEEAARAMGMLYPDEKVFSSEDSK